MGRVSSTRVPGLVDRTVNVPDSLLALTEAVEPTVWPDGIQVVTDSDIGHDDGQLLRGVVGLRNTHG